MPEIGAQHHETHEDGGSDEISLDGLTPTTHADRHENGGLDEVSVLGLSGLLGDSQTPLAHKTSHASGGSDALALAAYNFFKTADAYNTIVQGTWAYEVDTQHVLNFALGSGGGQNDEITYKFSHKAGSFTFVMVVKADVNRGIATISLDGTSQGTIDLYAAATARNSIKTLAITIATDGEHILSIKAATKHGSSSGYILSFCSLWIRDS